MHISCIQTSKFEGCSNTNVLTLSLSAPVSLYSSFTVQLHPCTAPQVPFSFSNLKMRLLHKNKPEDNFTGCLKS